MGRHEAVEEDRMGKLEQKINSVLQRFPGVKKGVKRLYQRAMYMVLPKLKSEGAIRRVTPMDGYEYFFGYYDKCPWDITGRYLLCLRVKDAYTKPDNDCEAQLVLIDSHNDDAVRPVATTHCWNVQQGCMLQWLDGERVIYNDFRDGKYCSVVLDVFSGGERVLPMPVYNVSADGSFALTLDFSRLHRLRPGYGYCNLPEKTAGEKCPDADCVWRMELRSGECAPLYKYTDFVALAPRPDMEGAEHKINHLMISPDGERFMVLHRWFVGERKFTRLVTGDCRGGGLRVLLDDGFVSHCCWKDEGQILTFAEKKGQGRGYFLLRDGTDQCTHLWPSLVGDGHPTYGPDGRVVTDSYPDRRRVANVYVLDEDKEETPVIARVFAPFRYDGDVRCDLHPRWSRDGSKICFDSVFEGKRGLYTVDVEELV